MEALHVLQEAVEGVATSRHQRDGFQATPVRECCQPELLIFRELEPRPRIAQTAGRISAGRVSRARLA